MNNIKIAWRNLWRNKRRTLITVASVFFGVLFSTVMTSMQEGSYSSMVDNVVKFYSGYIQVHSEDYWENKTINNTFKPTDSLIDKISQVKEVIHFTPRLESFALASSEEITKGVMVLGVDPVKESQVTGIEKWIEKGRYLNPGDKGILVGIDLAKYLQLELNDTIVLLSQGYHGISAAGKYPIAGILNFPSPELNRQTLYMELSNCQDFYSAYNLLTSLVLMVKNQYDLPDAMKELRNEISSPFSVMSWNEMQPELVQMIEADRAGGVFMKALLYMIIGFGILGTIMMMISERRREMGVMVAIGMQRFKLGNIIFLETLFIGFLGVLVGFLGSIPIISYYYNNPIRLPADAAEIMIEMGIEPLLYFSWMPSVFYNQVITIFVITALIAIYPVYKSRTMKVNLALRA
ncbi:MAG: FtsX-like permease family protein [Bacteroidetes bacterium]|nr:FtsX-like permease family protein [Bacteroidota bacterium]